MPPCLLLDSDLSLDAVASQPLLFADDRWLIAHDLSGTPLATPIRFGLALSPTFLYFGYAQAVSSDTFTPRPVGEFFEGLWEEQVLELFLAADSGERYQEFNLSPSGAWWTQPFSAHRVRDNTIPAPKSLEVFAEEGSAGSRSFFRVPRSALLVACSLSVGSRANITAIVLDPRSKEKRFCAVHDTGPGAADFHSPSGFKPFDFLG